MIADGPPRNATPTSVDPSVTLGVLVAERPARAALFERLRLEGREDRDWRRTSIAELCAHIVLVHHEGLREALPEIEALLSTVVRVHGASHPELSQLQRAF